MYRGWTQTDYQNKHYNINQKWLQHVQGMDTNRLPKQAPQYKPKDEGTQDNRRRDGGTNFILRFKEQETRLTFQEHDNDGECYCCIQLVVYTIGPFFGRQFRCSNDTTLNYLQALVTLNQNKTAINIVCALQNAQ